MKTILTLLVLVATALASVLEVTTPRKTFLLPTRITRLTAFSPDGITIRWIPVRINREPVIGYKVNLRVFGDTTVNKIETVYGAEDSVEDIEIPKANLKETEDSKVNKTESVNGTVDSVEKIEKLEIGDVTLESPHKLHQYNINNANHTELTIHGIKRERPYMVEVLAYSNMGDGPTSPVLGFQIRNTDHITFIARHNVEIYNRLGSTST